MVSQLLYFLGALVISPTFPFLFYLGKKLKREIPKLPEASKNSNGYTGLRQKESLKMVVLGESTMAGVGVSDHVDGIAGQIAKTIYEQTGKEVSWLVMAKSGYTAEDVVFKLVPELPREELDLLIIGLGANDTFAFNSPATWKKNISLLIKNLRKTQAHCPIVFTQLPPIDKFPAFPRIFQLIMGALVKLHANTLKQIVARHAEVYFIETPFVLGDAKSTIAEFFSDGVHPSMQAYAIWGREVGSFVLQNELLQKRNKALATSETH